MFLNNSVEAKTQTIHDKGFFHILENKDETLKEHLILKKRRKTDVGPTNDSQSQKLEVEFHK